MSKETIDLKDLDDLLCKYEVKDLEDLENRFKNVPKLEAKLAESEKQRQHLKDWLDNEILTSVDSESYYATINEYEEEVKKLKQRLEESESELVLAKNTSINTNKMEILHLQIENEELKQQLAEKDEQIEKILKENEELIIKYNVYNYGDKIQQDKVYSITGEALELLINRPNQKAIEQLEKVKENIHYLLSFDYNLVCRVNEQIDNQIEELKKEMK